MKLSKILRAGAQNQPALRNPREDYGEENGIRALSAAFDALCAVMPREEAIHQLNGDARWTREDIAAHLEELGL